MPTPIVKTRQPTTERRGGGHRVATIWTLKKPPRHAPIMQPIQDKSGSGVLSLPKDEQERDGFLDDGDIPDDQNILVERSAKAPSSFGCATVASFSS